MAWRSYVDPSTGEVWWTDGVPGDASANYIPDSQYTGPRNGTGNTAPTGSGYDYPRLGNALGDLNQQDFDEMRRQFEARLELERQQFGLSQQELDERRRQFDRSMYANLATSLLSGATSLRGPGNWLQYGEFTNGGKDIFQQLYGSQPAPSFGAPTGNSPAASITDILKALGITTMPGTASTGTASNTGGTYQTINGPKTLQQMEAELRAAGWAGGEDVATAYARTTGGAATPGQAAAATPVSAAMGAGGQASSLLPTLMGQTETQGFAGSTPQDTKPGMYDPSMPTGPFVPYGTSDKGDSMQRTSRVTEGDYSGTPRGTGGTPTIPGTNSPYAPLPHQINPAVWDSLSNTAKQMILAAAEKGYTPSGAWAADDYLSQFNASRPKGSAPKRVGYNWGNSQSLF